VVTDAVDTKPKGEVLASVKDGVGRMTFSSPARYNALSFGMFQQMPAILEAFRTDPDVRVVVMTGAGDKAFVSGADISEFGERRTQVDARAEYEAALDAAAVAWERLDKPVIARIRGYCLGGGLRMALQADIRIAAEGSRFAIPAARLGLGYAAGAVRQLVGLVGPGWASEILFSARQLSAEEALQAGLLNRVVPVADLDAEVDGLAATMAANAPLTLRAAKAAIREAGLDASARHPDLVRQLVEACFRSEDYKEGQRAFLEKRPPDFQGR
jgi:enoyl-CoA hydratase/carnithine racemase